MSTETENHDLTEDQLSDVFNQMADTFDKEAGINQPEVSANEDHEDDDTLDPAANLVPDANAQNEPNDEPAEEVFDVTKLPSIAQKAFQDLEHKANSQSGRVSALQKKLDEQSRQLQQLQEQGKGSSTAAQNLEQEIERTEIDLGGLQEELPELNNLVKAISTIEQKVNGFYSLVQNEVITPAQKRAADDAHAREQSALTDAHKDFAEIESNPHFWNWVDAQHPSIGALAESGKAADASYVLSLYKKSHPPATEPETPPPKQKINRNVDDMMALPTNGQVSSSTVDESAAFEWAAGQIKQGKL